MELKAIWNTILRRKWIVVQSVLVVFLSAIIGSFLLTPAYKATARILIKKSDSESYLLSNVGLDSRASPRDIMKIEDHVELVIARPLLEKVITKLQLTDREGNLIEPDSFREYTIIIHEIFPKPTVEVDLVERDEMETEKAEQIQIIARATDPDEAAMIANTVVEEYIAENLRMRKEDFRDARRYIKQQIVSVKAEYIGVLEKIKKFQKREKTVDLETETRESIARLFELMEEKEDNIIRVSEVLASIKKLVDQLNKQSETAVFSSSINENRAIEELKNTIIEFELELEGQLIEKKQDHPDILIVKQKLKKAKEELKHEIDLIKVFSTEKRSLERELAELKARRKSQEKEIDRFMNEFYAIPEKAFGDDQLQLEYKVKQEMYQSLLNYLYQIRVAEAALSSDVKLVEAAYAPHVDNSYSPNMGMNSILGIALGLIFGFGLCFLVESLDDSVKGVEDIKAHGLLLLGAIPRVKRKKNALVFEGDSKDQIYEFYRMIKNTLKYSDLEMPVKSLLITSAVNREGRSSAVLNLGATIAHEGKRVLIVDTDLRNPMLDQLIGVSCPDGITYIFEENRAPEEVIKNIEKIDGLSLLAAGPPLSDPCRVVESDKMRQLITDLTKQYDIVILDSSPLLLSNDAVSLAKYVDTSILVLESGKISHPTFSRLIDHLKNVNIELAGVILNKIVKERRGELL